jgi:hypothetical protein
MDGWLIVQSRKADEEQKQRHTTKISDKMSKANEVFIPVETSKDAERVHQMNDPHARMVKRQRMQMIAKQGAVEEQKMPDAQLQLRQKALEGIRNRAAASRR